MSWREMNWFVLRIDWTHDNDEEDMGINRISKIPSEDKVLALLAMRLDENLYTAFVPKKAYPHIKKGKLINVELKTLFPGYVFIATPKDERFVLMNTKKTLERINGVHFFLSYKDGFFDGVHQKSEFVMREYERNNLARLMNDEFIVDYSKGYIEGDRVRIASGPFEGCEGLIKKVNRRKMTAIVSMENLFGGGRADMTIMLEIVEKANL